VLVSFQLRQGRVRSWSQRACGEKAATARVESTPADWRTFAARNAALAARMIARAESG
jgi:excinuclease ABC subunit C